MRFFKAEISNATQNINDFPNAQIPRIIHFFARTNCVSKQIFQNIQLWVQTNHTVFLHNLEDIKEHIEKMEEVPIAKKIWDCASTHEAKIDIARLVFLYRYGGVNVDLDLIQLKEHCKFFMRTRYMSFYQNILCTIRNNQEL